MAEPHQVLNIAPKRAVTSRIHLLNKIREWMDEQLSSPKETHLTKFYMSSGKSNKTQNPSPWWGGQVSWNPSPWDEHRCGRVEPPIPVVTQPCKALGEGDGNWQSDESSSTATVWEAGWTLKRQERHGDICGKSLVGAIIPPLVNRPGDLHDGFRCMVWFMSILTVESRM